MVGIWIIEKNEFHIIAQSSTITIILNHVSCTVYSNELILIRLVYKISKYNTEAVNSSVITEVFKMCATKPRGMSMSAISKDAMAQ